MDDELISKCDRKPLVKPIFIKLGVICGSLLAVGWFFLKLTQGYGAMRFAEDGNEFAGPVLGFVLLFPWSCAAYLGVKYLKDWLRSELETRKDEITQLVIYKQHLEVIHKHFTKVYHWADFKEHAYIEYTFIGHHFALHLTATDSTYIMLDDETYDHCEKGVSYLNAVVPRAILPRLLDAIRNGKSVQIFPYVLDAQGISGQGRRYQWCNLVALHLKVWRDCELIFREVAGNLDRLTLECENTNVYIAPDLIREIIRDNKIDIEIVVDPVQPIKSIL